jgi:hypothetical protein
MRFAEPPPWAAWRHHDARDGFEVVFLQGEGGGRRAEGQTTAVEGGAAWAVTYEIRLGMDWLTRSARVAGRSAVGARERVLEADGTGGWLVDGAPALHLDGCLDVDLEASCLTNSFPVHRLELEVGGEAEAPAAYVRADDLAVERLEQRYVRLEDAQGLQRYRYAAPAFEFECELVYDRFGLLLDYPGIGVRVEPPG